MANPEYNYYSVNLDIPTPTSTVENPTVNTPNVVIPSVDVPEMPAPEKITTGADWSEVTDDDGTKPEDGADVTGDNTALDTENVNSEPSTNVQPRAEDGYKKLNFRGASNDGLTELASSATITRNEMTTKLDTSAVGDNDGEAHLYSGVFGSNDFTDAGNLDWNEDFDITFRLSFDDTDDGGGDKRGYFFGITDIGVATGAGNSPAYKVMNDDRFAAIGFKYTADQKFWVFNDSGSAETETEVTGETPKNFNTLRIVYRAGTDVKFYINDVLEATHTTNLPSGTSTPFLYFGVYTEDPGGGSDIGRIVLANNYRITADV